MKSKFKLAKLFLLAGLFFSLGFHSHADYLPNGSATASGGDCFILTLPMGAQGGSVWCDQPFSLAYDFDLSFQVYLGDNNDGADGIAFIIMPSPGGLGGVGGGLGYMDLSPSLAVEYDTYTNLDPVEDHIAIQMNGDVNPGGTLAGPVQASAISPDIEDGVWHSTRFTWDASTNTLAVYFDDVLRLSYSDNIVASIFGGNPLVYWGFTGATGGAVNLQQFCVTSLYFEAAAEIPLSPWIFAIVIFLIMAATFIRYRKGL